MSRGPYSRRIPVLITLVIALMLSVVPLPDWLEVFRPDWLALALIYWAMTLPRTWSVGSAWLVGQSITPIIKAVRPVSPKTVIRTTKRFISFPSLWEILGEGAF